MSSLRSALDELVRRDLTQIPDARLEEDFQELHRGCELMELARMRHLAELDRRRLYERDGHLSAAGWLAGRFKMAWGFARELLRCARALEDMPATREGLVSGEISTSAARVLVGARDGDGEAFRDFESELVESARLHSVNDLKRVTAYWREAVDRSRHHDLEDRLRRRRRLHASVTFMGMVRVDGDLDPETGAAFLTALRAIQDADARVGDGDDDRTPAQCRADALGEFSRQFLDRGDRPTVAGERPHITVTADVGILSKDGYGSGELDDGGRVRSEALRRLACDASITRVVLAGTSEPLDVGRRTPVVPPAIRRAVVVRDAHCRFPACDRPQAWCDAHHVVHWADGGETALANLLLLCRRHHRLVHEGRFQLRFERGEPVFRRPDGSVLDDRAPPIAAAS